MTKEQLAEQHAEFLFPKSIQQIEFTKTGADMNEVSERSYLAGYEAAQPKWVSVETPPEKEGAYLTFPHFTVLVYDNNDGEWEANYWNNWDSYMDMVIKDNDVKFWMHLPNAPSHE